MKWILTKQEIIAILAYTAGPNSFHGERAIAQQRNIAFDTVTGEIIATDGASLLLVGTGLLPKGKASNLVIVPPEALEHHRAHAKRASDVCEIEILDEHTSKEIMVTSADEAAFFKRFDGFYPPVHQIFGAIDLVEQTPAGGFPAAQLERLGKIARATGEKHIVFAGGRDAKDPSVFTAWAPKTEHREARRWVAVVMPTAGCEVLAATLRNERAKIQAETKG